MNLIDKVRKKVEKDKRSYREIEGVTGVDHSKLWYFVKKGKNLSLVNFVKLIELYDLAK